MVIQELTYGDGVDVALHGTFDLGHGNLKSTVVRSNTAGWRACLRGNGRCDTLTSDECRHQGGKEDRKGLHLGDVG